METDHSSGLMVQCENLRKHYGKLEALAGVSFAIEKGEVFGLLGPNGAGKTTTIEILEGLRQPDGGIGAQLQATVLPDKIRVDEAVRLFTSFYSQQASLEILLDRFGLAEKRHSFFESLSGGQKQRLALALSLVNDPELVFLDEPTVGLDVQLRRDIHALIQELRDDGRTVLLTTHYIEEAEQLCDRVAIIDRGRLVALGSPRELVQKAGQGTRLEIRLSKPVSPARLKELDAILDCREADGTYFLHANPPAQAVVSLIRFLEAEGNTLLDMHIAQPSLEDIFVEMTGRRLSE